MRAGSVSEFTGQYAQRHVPAAGIYVCITRKCPLGCAHCSTNSTMDSEELDAGMLSDFIRTMQVDRGPGHLLMTGGEPLLRPALVQDIAAHCRSINTKTGVITGAYFAKMAHIPSEITDALREVDVVTVSLDVFHEDKVPRDRIMGCIAMIRELGPYVGVQLLGLRADDPYLDQSVRDLRQRFNDEVPIFVSLVHPVGRASDLVEVQTHEQGGRDIEPCALATWPVVRFDGHVVACCKQEAIDITPPPPHLHVGHVSHLTWDEVRDYSRNDGCVKAIRAVGPDFLARRAGLPVMPTMCGTCLGNDPDDLADSAASFMANDSANEMAATIQRLMANRPYTHPKFEHLLSLSGRGQ